MKKKCITNVVTDAGNQGQLPWLATLVTKVTTMVTTMVTMMVTTMVTTMVTITNLGYRGCVTDYYLKAFWFGNSKISFDISTFPSLSYYDGNQGWSW